MGWTSTGDPYANVGDSALGFDSELAAKSFAERHGWDYVVMFFPTTFVIITLSGYNTFIHIYMKLCNDSVLSIYLKMHIFDLTHGRSRSPKHRY